MKTIRLQFTNGLSFSDSKDEIFPELNTEYNFIEDNISPQVVIFGPYGNNVPQGKFIRVGYFCENFIPDMNACEYGFGIPYENEIQDAKYRRIDFHGFNPKSLIKEPTFAEEAIKNKKHFCNFLYGNKVPYREEFFKALSKYKKVDAPGKSMKNMADLPGDSNMGIWNSKRSFISEYKFTIAFENYTYPGYHTEKILDPMVAGSIPIYVGNPEIEKHFNKHSFIHGRNFIQDTRSKFILNIEKSVQPDYEDWRPSVFNNPIQKLKRKAKIIGRGLKLKFEFKSGFDHLISEIIRLDKDDNAYFEMLKEPWYKSNMPPDRSRFINQWREIFESV
jgi:hypothetical protein